jgi:cardiolipin synthase
MSYRPEIARFRLRRHRLRRLHRKLVVIDGRLAFVGGINVIDDNNAPADLRPRFDYAVRLEGPVLREVHHAGQAYVGNRFVGQFQASLPAGPHDTDHVRRHRNTDRSLPDPRQRPSPQRHPPRLPVHAIDAAREEILIANAYFLPGVRFGRALNAAPRRGVRITVLFQGKTDHPLLRYATQALYERALDAGIRIFEYEKSFMHAKVAVIDGHWATVGSSNIDPFSLLLAKEANVVIRDDRFAGELRASLLHAIESGAREMSAAELDRQPVHSRFLRWLSYALVRALVGVTGYGPKHWRSDEQSPGNRP